VYIISWHGNVVMGNQILNNSVGITVNIETVQDYMYQFRENIILNNTFENAQNAVNKAEGVIYEPLSNAWDDGEAGNYWSDYNGTDADGDGVREQHLRFHRSLRNSHLHHSNFSNNTSRRFYNFSSHHRCRSAGLLQETGK
jgi:nitrous oxidase accessory protein NosD